MTPEQREKGVEPFHQDAYDTVQRALVYIEGNLMNEAVGVLKQFLTNLDRRSVTTEDKVIAGGHINGRSFIVKTVKPNQVEIEGCAPPVGPTNGLAYPNELTEEILMDLKAKVDEMNRALNLMANDVKFIRAQQPYKP